MALVFGVKKIYLGRCVRAVLALLREMGLQWWIFVPVGIQYRNWSRTYVFAIDYVWGLQLTKLKPVSSQTSRVQKLHWRVSGAEQVLTVKFDDLFSSIRGFFVGQRHQFVQSLLSFF